MLLVKNLTTQWRETEEENRLIFRKKAQVFLGLLVVPFLAGRPGFCMVVLMLLTVGLAMGRAELTGGGLLLAWWGSLDETC